MIANFADRIKIASDGGYCWFFGDENRRTTDGTDDGNRDWGWRLFLQSSTRGKRHHWFVDGIEGSAFGAALGGPREIEIIVYRKYLDSSQAIIVELDEEVDD